VSLSASVPVATGDVRQGASAHSTVPPPPVGGRNSTFMVLRNNARLPPLVGVNDTSHLCGAHTCLGQQRLRRHPDRTLRPLVACTHPPSQGARMQRQQRALGAAAGAGHASTLHSRSGSLRRSGCMQAARGCMQEDAPHRVQWVSADIGRGNRLQGVACKAHAAVPPKSGWLSPPMWVMQRDNFPPTTHARAQACSTPPTTRTHAAWALWAKCPSARRAPACATRWRCSCACEGGRQGIA
jgi:hypothetical protein